MNSESRSPVEHESAQPGDVGDLLRASRLRRGEELGDVARALRIRSVYLHAIEAGRYDDLPGTVYVIGFIRSYAEHLGLDGEQIVNRFKADASGQAKKTKLVFPVAIPEHGMPRGAVVTLGALILIGAYGGWYFLSSKDLYITDLIPPVPDSIVRAFDATRTAASDLTLPRQVPTVRSEPMAAVAATAPEPKAASKPVETAALQPPKVEPKPGPAVPAPVVAPLPAPVGAPPAAAAPATPEPPEAADEGDDEVDSTPAPTASAPETEQSAAAQEIMLDDRGGVDALASGSQLANLPGVHDPNREVVLQAVVDCWIEIRDTIANQRVASRLLRKGDKYTVPMRDGLILVAGNAGGLEVRVGGDVAPSLGPLGVVRRNVSLDPQKLRDGTAVVE